MGPAPADKLNQRASGLKDKPGKAPSAHILRKTLGLSGNLDELGSRQSALDAPGGAILHQP